MSFTKDVGFEPLMGMRDLHINKLDKLALLQVVFFFMLVLFR